MKYKDPLDPLDEFTQDCGSCKTEMALVDIILSDRLLCMHCEELIPYHIPYEQFKKYYEKTR